MANTSRSIILSERRPDYQKQYALVRGLDGSLSIAPPNRFVLTLPPELTSEIFLYCLPDSDFIHPDPFTAPLLLCHVCRPWRHIALDTPGIWASLHLNLAWFCPPYEEAEEEEEEAEELLDLPAFFRDWISNARNMPLSVHVEDDHSSPPKHEVEPLLSMIGRRSAQWHKIMLCVSPAYFCLVFPSESLIFPSLHHLAVRNACLFETPWMLDIRWQRLTVFRSENIGVSECIHILRNGPSLLSCTFHLCRENYRVPFTSLPPLDLQALEITETTTQLLILTLLQHLTLPALQHLALRFDGLRHTHRDFSRLVSFASRSAFTLKHLTLRLLPVPEALLIQSLHAFPSVIDLQLQLRQPADDLVRHFQYDVDLLPHLESLHIVQIFPHRTAHDSAGLLRMLAARWEPPHPESRRKAQLRSFRLADYAMPKFISVLCSDAKFCVLQEQGMELDFEGFWNINWSGTDWYIPYDSSGSNW
jgi:hypothetical protein